MDELRLWDLRGKPSEAVLFETLGCNPKLTDEEALRQFGVADHFRVTRSYGSGAEPAVIQAGREHAYPNGAPMFSPSGTMLDEHGNRSIFDDIDQ